MTKGERQLHVANNAPDSLSTTISIAQVLPTNAWLICHTWLETVVCTSGNRHQLYGLLRARCDLPVSGRL